jgi:hypothetical protein
LTAQFSLREISVEQPANTHQCLPHPARRCIHCGATLSAPVFCATCGADITPTHHCEPNSLPHICKPLPAIGRCLACGETLPQRRFCASCGADITPSHRCSAAPATHVHRSDPVHVCPVLEVPTCSQCGALLPQTFCESCGMDITPLHVCTPVEEAHVCPPVMTMPKRCAKCGEQLPAPRFCEQCGVDLTPTHQCPA